MQTRSHGHNTTRSTHRAPRRSNTPRRNPKPLPEPTENPYKLPARHGHILVVGATGSGKSTISARLALESMRHAKTIILDWAREHVEALVDKPGAQVIVPGQTHSIPLKTSWGIIPDIVEKTSYYCIDNIEYPDNTTTIPTTSLSPNKNRQLYTPSTSHNTKKLTNNDKKDVRRSADALVSRLIYHHNNQATTNTRKHQREPSINRPVNNKVRPP